MNPLTREELAARMMEGRLHLEDEAELRRQMQADPDFAREVEANETANQEFAETAGWLRNHPALALPDDARDRIRATASARASRRKPWVWLIGLASVCSIAAVAFLAERRANIFSPDDTTLAETAGRGRTLVEEGGGGVRTPTKYLADTVSRGGTLFAQAAQKNPATRIGVWEPEKSTVRACLWIVEADWNAWSADERDAVIAFLKAEVPAMRSDPARFAGVPPADPAYEMIRGNIAQMRTGAFIVFTMIRNEGAWTKSGTAASG